MNSRNAALRRYYRRIRSWLPCSRRLKKQIIEEIKASVAEYLSENPDADFSQIESHFGKPQSIASAYVEDLDTGSLLRSLRIRRRVMTIVSCTAVVVLISWGAYIAGSIVFQAMYLPGYIEVSISDETVDLSTDPDAVRYYP